ncbi:MAG: hypothetical protein IJ141_07435, partial [Lachnospiraceae bacterium]|nr:hypothetical protein [Lachnospiraceae bacterium]
LKGDFYACFTDNAGNNNLNYSFMPSGSHTVILSGEEKQKVEIRYEDESNLEQSGFNNLVFSNSSNTGIELTNNPKVYGSIEQNETVIEGSIVLAKDAVLSSGKYKGNVILYGITFNNDTEIYGNVILRRKGKNINTCMTVKSNVNIYGDVISDYEEGNISIQSGNLYISGNSNNNTYSKNGENNTLKIDGDMTAESSFDYSGEIEVKGDISVKNGFYADKLILSGEEKQTITYANKLNIKNLELNNYSDEGIVSDHMIYKDIMVDNGCRINYEDLIGNTDNTYTEGIGSIDDLPADIYSVQMDDGVTRLILNSDYTYDGNMYLYDKNLDLNGHTLTINGDLTHASGVMYINHGTLDVKGNYTIRYIVDLNNDLYAVSSARPVLDNEDDVIKTGGSFSFVPNYNIKLNAGKIYIKGDFDLQEPDISREKEFLPYRYSTSYTHIIFGKNMTIIMNGDSKQSVLNSGRISLYRIELNNSSEDGIYIDDSLEVFNYINDYDSVVDGTIKLYSTTEIADNVFSGSILGGTLNVNDAEFTVLRDVNADYINVTNGTLNIEGKLSRGEIKLNGGIINVKGNVSCNISNMYKSNDEINVGGNFKYNGSKKKSVIANGTISVKGDCELNKYYSKSENKIIMDGDKLQNLTVIESEINILEINNQSDEGVVALCYFDANEIILNGKFQYDNSNGNYGWKLTKDEEFDGDFNLLAGNLDLNGFTMTVKGNFIQDGGSIVFNGGELKVEGDFTRNDGVYNQYSNDTLFVEGNINIKKNTSFGGTIECKGDFTSGQDLKGGTIIFSGDNKQTVKVTDDSKLSKIEVLNTSSYGVFTQRYIKVKKIIDENNKYKVNQNNYKEGFTLEEDTTINGSYLLGYGTLDLNGHTLTINGSLVQADAEIIINGGYLDIRGDLKQQIRNWNGNKYVYTNSDASIIMDNENDHISVSENVYLQSEKNKFNKGKIDIAGNIEGHNTYFSKGIFNEDITLNLNGKNKQTISIPLKVTRLNVSNNTEICTDKSVEVLEKLELEGCKLTGNNYISVGNIEDITAEKFEGNIYIRDAVNASQNISIDGSFTFENDVNLNGNHLYVESATIKKDFSLNGGRLSCRNDLIVDENGKLNMTNSYDYVDIGNTFYFNSNVSHEGFLSAGTLVIMGDFIQGENDNFIADGSHKTIMEVKLTSTGRNYIQTLSFSANDGSSIFNTLVLKKTEDKYSLTRAADMMARNVIYELYDKEPPEGPKEIKVTATTTSSISFEIIMDSYDDIHYYEIYRDGLKLADTSKNAYKDEALNHDTEYTYEVYTYDYAHNKSVDSKIITIKTLKDTQAPTVPGNLSIVKLSGSSVVFTWTKSKDDRVVAGYDIYKDDAYVCSVTEPEYTETNLSIDEIYEYKIVAFDDVGNKSDYSEILKVQPQVTKIVSVYPEDYSKLDKKNNKLSIYFKNYGSQTEYNIKTEYYDLSARKWNDITEDDISYKAYNVETNVAEVMWDTSDLTDSEYLVRYIITDEEGNELSKKVTYYLDNVAPGKVSNLKVLSDNGTIKLSWDISIAVDCAGYRIYRRTDDEYQCIKVIDDKFNISYTDKDVEEGVFYEYVITAFDNDANESGYSSSVKAKAVADKKAPVMKEASPEAGKINGVLSIKAVASDNKEVKTIVYEMRHEDSDEWIYLGERETDSTGTASYGLDTGVYSDGIYYVKMTAYDKAGNESEEEFVRRYEIDNTGISKIKITKTSKSSTFVRLEWEDVPDDDLAYFRVEMLYNGTFEFAGTSENILGIVINNLKPNTYYAFRVVGYDKLGNRGIESDIVSVRTDYDTIAPVVKSVGPAIGAYNSMLSLRVNAEDNSEVAFARFYYSLDGENYNLINTVGNAHASKSATFSYDFDISGFEDGSIYIKTEVYDGHMNKSVLPDGNDIVAEYIIDKKAPSKVQGFKNNSNIGAVSLMWDMPDDDTAGFKILRSDQNDGYYKLIADNVKSLNYYDYNTIYGCVYAYKIYPYDYAGNVNEESDIVVVTVGNDTENPVVRGVQPKSQSIVGEKTGIQVAVTDNALIDTITMEYKLKDNDMDIWLLADEKKIEWLGDIYTLCLPLYNMDEGSYDIRIKATDMSGNVSDYYYCTYVLDNTPPDADIDVYADGSLINIDIKCEDEDAARYEIYRKKIGTNGEADSSYKKIAVIYEDSYVDETTIPDTFYQYKVMAYDNVENCSENVSSYVNSIDIDNKPPIAVLPERFSAIEGMEIELDGGESSDNKRIDIYEWDMGNGDIIYGSRPVYIYNEPGNYTIKLTVYDEAGNSSFTYSDIEVLSRKDTGKVKITVKDTFGNIIPYASIYVNDSTEDSGKCYKTDSMGRLTVAIMVGSYDIAAYKIGYLPKEKYVSVDEFNDTELELYLPSGELVTGYMDVHRMSLQEMVDAGVNIWDTSNLNQYTVEASFGYEEKPVEERVVYVDNEKEWAFGIGDGYKKKAGEPGGTEDSGRYKEGYAVISYPSTGNDEINKSDEGSQEILMYINVSQTISWLKDMFMVDLTIMNNADSKYYINDACAIINLPDGLSLASTEKGQKKTCYIDDLYGQHITGLSWVVRVDNPGKYEISADFKGKLQPFDYPVNATFKAEKKIESGDFSGLVITLSPEQRIYPDEDAYVQISISNRTGRPLYNFSSTLSDYIEPGYVYSVNVIDNIHDESDENYIGGDNENRIYSQVVPGANLCGQTYVYKGNNRISIPVLEDGETIYGTYKAHISGDKDKYYELKESMYKTIVGENLNVTVRIAPILPHVHKEILSIEKNPYEYGDPVDMSTGGYTDSVDIMSLNGKAAFPFTLSYNSLSFAESGDMGFGWSHNFENRIVDRNGLIYYYTSPSSWAAFASEDSLNDIIYGTVDGDSIYYTDEALEKDIVYKSITPCVNGYTLTRKTDGSFVMETPNKEVYTYDSDGMLSSVTLINGAKCFVTHNDNSTVIEDEYGGKFSLNYNNGLVTSVTDNNGRQAIFSYTDGRLTRITDVTGVDYIYSYNDEGILDKASNSQGEVYVENTYDELGRVITQTDSYGQLLSFSYEDDESGMTVTATDSDGNVTVVESDELCNITSIKEPNGYTEKHTYDENGRLASTTDAKGNTYNYTHDEKGNITGFTSPTKEGMTFSYDDNGNVTSFTGLDGSYINMTYEGINLTSMDRNGIKTSYGYNEEGLADSVYVEGKGTAYYEYDGLNISRYTDALGHVTNYDYDSFGNLISITDAEGNTTRFNYDAAGRITGIIKPNGSAKTYTYDMYGAIASMTDEFGHITSYLYDTAGNLTAVTYPDKSTFYYEYDMKGNCISITRPDGEKTEYEYDISGNVIKINYPDGTSESYTYDIYGRKNSHTDKNGKTVTCNQDMSGKIDSINLPNGFTAELGYNSKDKIESIKVDDAEYGISYDVYGNVSETTDCMGNTTEFEYDIYGELLSKTDANGNTSRYDYDALGNLVGITYPNGTRVDYSYDRSNRVNKAETTIETDEGEKTIKISCGYDEDGNVISYTDEVGTTTTYTYDEADRITGVYDAYGDLIQDYVYDSMGRVCETGAQDGSKTLYAYDSMGNIIKKTESGPGGVSKTYEYAYDINGNVISTTDTSGTISSQSFDNAGNLTSVTYPMGGGIEYTYEDNKLIKEKLSIGTEYNYEYNADNLLSSYTNGRNQETTYEYDKLGRITSLTDELGTISYTYDGCGNVLTVSETDKEGNTSTIKRTYDCMNRVSSYTDYKGNTVKYGYDELGNLISLTYAGGEIVRYKYYDNGALKEVIDAENLITSYTYDKR